MRVKIITVAKQLPLHSRPTADILPYLEKWLSGQDERFIKKAMKISANAGVEKRYSIMGTDEVLANASFEEKNDHYVRECKKLAEQSLKKALDKAGWKARDIDYLITVSCTGIMIPSVDAYLVNSLKMKRDIV